MVREMNHIGLRVMDVDAAIRLYADILGGVVIRNSGSLDGKSRFVYVQLGASVLELITAFEPAAQGYAHVAFLVDAAGLDAAYNKLCAMGYEFTVKPKVAGSGDGRLAFFKDESGIIYELIERVENIRRPAFSTPLVKEFAYATVGVKPDQLEKTDAFYTDELSFTRDSDGLYAFGGDHLRAVAAEQPCIESFTLKVNDLALTCETLMKAGFKTNPDADGAILTGAGGETVRLLQAQ